MFSTSIPSMIDAVQNAYALFEQFNISITSLIVLLVILSLAFLFSVREAASWFFKVDDLKRDIQRLRDITIQLEGEIRALQSVAGIAKNQAALNSIPNLVMDEPASQDKSVPHVRLANFPIVH